MNARIKSMAIVSTILAGVVAAGAQQPERRQQQRQNTPDEYGQKQCCPACGAPLAALRQRNQNQSRQYAAGQQFQGRRNAQQLAPQQRQQILQRFDRDGDGKLSEQERNAVKARIQQRMQGTTPRFEPNRQRDAKQELQRPQQEKSTTAQRRPFQAKRQTVIQLFDSDGDGVLSSQEKTAMKKEFKELLADKQAEKSRSPRKEKRAPEADDAD